MCGVGPLSEAASERANVAHLRSLVVPLRTGRRRRARGASSHGGIVWMDVVFIRKGRPGWSDGRRLKRACGSANLALERSVALMSNDGACFEAKSFQMSHVCELRVRRILHTQ